MGSGGMLPQKDLKFWSFEQPFLVFWEYNFSLKCSLNRLSFLRLSVIFPWFRLQVTWLDVILIFCAVLKVFCASVSGKYVFLYKYRKNSFGKNHNRCQNRDFSYPDRILVGIRDFQAKSGESRRNRDVWIVCILTLSRLRKQPIFRDVTTGFLAKGRLRNEHRNSILMTCHLPDLCRTSDRVKQIF